jgi:hypothetical protein
MLKARELDVKTVLTKNPNGWGIRPAGSREMPAS